MRTTFPNRPDLANIPSEAGSQPRTSGVTSGVTLGVALGVALCVALALRFPTGSTRSFTAFALGFSPQRILTSLYSSYT